jgi:hypothetical protein
MRVKGERLERLGRAGRALGQGMAEHLSERPFREFFAALDQLADPEQEPPPDWVVEAGVVAVNWMFPGLDMSKVLAGDPYKTGKWAGRVSAMCRQAKLEDQQPELHVSLPAFQSEMKARLGQDWDLREESEYFRGFSDGIKMAVEPDEDPVREFAGATCFCMVSFWRQFMTFKNRREALVWMHEKYPDSIPDPADRERCRNFEKMFERIGYRPGKRGRPRINTTDD